MHELMYDSLYGYKKNGDLYIQSWLMISLLNNNYI